MDTRQIRLVQESFATLGPICEQVGALFFDRLFQLDPSLRKLFRGDMTEHGGKLMAMIRSVMHRLGNLPMLLPALEDLGRRHLADGVEDRHYVTVAVALLWMLEKRLGAAFTPEMKDAWTAVYWVMADTMQDAARGEIAIGRRLKPAAREAATRA